MNAPNLLVSPDRPGAATAQPPSARSSDTPLHICIAGPIATADIAHLLAAPSARLPRGYAGAPVLGSLIEALLRRGHRVSAITLSSDLALEPPAGVVARGPGFDFHCCPMRPRAWPFNGRRPGRIVDLYAFERDGLARAMRRAQPDVVHAHWAYEFAWAALASGLPHLVTCHDAPFAIARYQRDVRHGAYRWLRAGMAWHVLRQASHVTTVSPYMVGQVQPLCRVPVSVIPNPVSSQALMPAPATAPLARRGRQRVLMVANGWSVLKNGQAALRAFALLAAQRPAVELHAFGHDHGEGEAAQRWWQRSGLSGKLHFVGAVAHAELLNALAEADVLLHASLEESFGMVVAEALAAGVPVVAGAHSGAVPWVVGQAGSLVDVTRPDAIARALHCLLADPTESRRLGQLGRQRMRAMFGADTVAKAYEREYLDVLADRRMRPGAAAARHGLDSGAARS